MLDDEIIDKLITIESINGMSDHTSTNIHVAPIVPTSFKVPGMLSYVEPDYEEYCNYYLEYIQWLSGYEVMCDEQYYYIKCDQKMIKPNEKILLPARLILKAIPDYIEYEIKTKHNPKIMLGKIENREN